ncbi:MAG TPA: DegT/DnrJ/EryC1/StrS family aminotransferase [Pirellulaceae bacterium]|nr:DegT/DnrJ/EryC1/StrS family aminotransferase [Pirellulaceae bacterium]HMO92668.1 DegT/DnrJ/EryC1/StrS family aminotransferase [Pirellulaceae bacterium]HMP70584.1 DegT/DnrJ/EryC1/StrS family aminotransferase [Pirellulaceae bacterium]
MWVRKRIDIRPREIVGGMFACLHSRRRSELLRQIEQQWRSERTLVCLSVRSGFELLWNSVGWPEGTEILMSGMTIPHMPLIVRKNGYQPVALDLDVRNLSVTAEQIRAKITPRTKAIVIAHLFGGLSDLGPVIEVAREHNLMVIEDCAQAYVGQSYTGDERADVSMFSFGAIKTNTSLCGGVFVVRNPQFLARMKQIHATWPVQTRLSMFKRLLKYSFVKLISTYYLSGTVAFCLRCIGKDHDGLAVRLSRGFAGGDFFKRIRQQPSSALLAIMERRFRSFDERTIVQRTKRGYSLTQAIRDSVQVLGVEMDRQTFWVLSILVRNRDEFVARLWDQGFDATGSCSLQPVDLLPGTPPECAERQTELRNIKFLLDHIVFLPFDSAMSSSELKRLASIIVDFEPGKLALPTPPTAEVGFEESSYIPR